MRFTSKSDRFVMHRIVSGRAFVLGDNVDSFAILGRSRRRSAAPALLGRYLLRSSRPELAARLRPGDVLVAGRNFGYRVHREHAVMAILGAGVRCVIAESFSRTFRRLAEAQGLALLECPAAARGIADGDRIEVDLACGLIQDHTFASRFQALQERVA